MNEPIIVSKSDLRTLLQWVIRPKPAAGTIDERLHFPCGEIMRLAAAAEGAAPILVASPERMSDEELERRIREIAGRS